MNRLGPLFAFLVALVLGGPALAQAGGRHMEVRLIAETAAVAPGSTVTLAFAMRPRAGWHGYWRNPGDAGAEPRVAWRLPEGWRAEALQYPVPTRLSVAGLTNYVFEGDYALLATLRVPDSAEPGVAFPVDARLDYLVCTDEVCVPETASVSTELRTGTPGAADPAFQGWRGALPRPLAGEARFESKGGRVRIAIPLPAGAALDDPYFYPGTLDALGHSAPQLLSRNGDWLIVETAAGRLAGSLAALEGVLGIGDGVGLSLTARRGDVPAAGTPVATVATAGGGGEGPALLVALLGALLGGLILNIMPCVFPILSLKALGLARAGETEAEARREALAYAAGVIGMCLALGGVLLALRAGGAAVGWAFQLQDPRVILLLLLLVTAISLNLAGLFNLPMLAGGEGLTGKKGAAGAFFTGALAAFIATPCTGPFMGAALGAALVLPSGGALAVFAGLGLGLALPFLLLGFVPALRRRLPRPGPWMATLQRILSVPMFLTALGLAWILGRQTGVDGMALGLAAVLALGLALWWLGKGGRWFAWALILVAALGPLLLLDAEPAAAARAESPLAAEPFSAARLVELRATGTPAFVYFTADWCLTCKVNERGALAQGEVAEAFRARGIRVLVGDWTRGDPEIGRFLARQGRSGVPLYLYYGPGREADVLPQILTTARLTRLGG
ncbi:MAG TPA: protein-disulfide reductase DsbD domain-containing protein [Allosphingosinicella sp.]|nr:protein-disulfide reductase DsbD domain-containing protein [Allosphingosinicella sp.]